MLPCVLVQSYSQSPPVRRGMSLTGTMWIIQRHLLVSLVNMCGGAFLAAPFFTARKRSLRRLCFYRCLSVHTGGGRAWLLGGAGMRGCSGGMRGCSGGCAWLLSGGHAWLLLWGCVVAAGGHAWLLLGGVHGCSRGLHGIQRDTEIRSMSGQYAS